MNGAWCSRVRCTAGRTRWQQRVRSESSRISSTTAISARSDAVASSLAYDASERLRCLHTWSWAGSGFLAACVALSAAAIVRALMRLTCRQGRLALYPLALAAVLITNRGGGAAFPHMFARSAHACRSADDLPRPHLEPRALQIREYLLMASSGGSGGVLRPDVSHSGARCGVRSESNCCRDHAVSRPAGDRSKPVDGLFTPWRSLSCSYQRGR